MSDFETLIKGTRDLFDDRQPYHGHYKRFRRKLGAAPSGFHTGFLRMAAAFLAGVIIASGMYIYFSGKSNKSVLSELPADVRETLYYYNMLSDERISEIREIPLHDNITKTRVLNDVNHTDKDYDKIIRDLKRYPGDKRVINALIEYHRSRAEFLEYVVNQLEYGSTKPTKNL